MTKQYCHYVFRTYKGKSTLVNKDLIAYLDNKLKEISNEKGFPIVAHNILEDHVHLLIQQAPEDSTDYVMRIFKGASSRYLFQKFPTNRLEHRKLWGRGYFSEIVPEKRLQEVVTYINSQKDSKGIDKRYGTARFTRGTD